MRFRDYFEGTTSADIAQGAPKIGGLRRRGKGPKDGSGPRDGSRCDADDSENTDDTDTKKHKNKGK